MAFEHEAGRLRKLARDRNVLIFFTGHAEVERKKDGISKVDIAMMLCRCSVSLVETNKESGEEEWRAEGTDCDGRKIAAVIALSEDVKEIKVVTTWAKKT
jgi:hypothetical protein